MSTSIPESSVNPSPLIPATTPSCSRSRSGESPFATRRRGEWSVSARYSCPSARAAATMRSIEVSPSDHSLCEWRSPRSSGRSSDAFCDPGALSQVRQVAGDLAGECLLDHRECGIADPLPATQGCGIPQLFVTQPRDGVGSGPERLRLVPRRSLALEERRDLVERVEWMHSLSAPPELESRSGGSGLLHHHRAPRRGAGTPSRTGWRGRPSRQRTARRRRRRSR